MDPPDSETRRQRSAVPASFWKVAPLEIARQCVRRFLRNLMVVAGSKLRTVALPLLQINCLPLSAIQPASREHPSPMAY